MISGKSTTLYDIFDFHYHYRNLIFSITKQMKPRYCDNHAQHMTLQDTYLAA